MKAASPISTAKVVWVCLLCLLQGKANAQSGTVAAWGSNARSQTNVPNGLVGVVQTASGGCQSLALKSDGSVAAWGQFINTSVSGQPYQSVFLLADVTNVAAVAAGDSLAVVLRSNGTVRAWGGNFYGETTGPQGFSGVTAIAAGGYHGLALKTNKMVIGWGANSYGEATPPQNLTNAVAVAAGKFHSVALRSDGTVTAWGYQYSGVTNVPAGLSNIVAIAAGSYHTLALKNDGTVFAWGRDYYGETVVPAGLTNVIAVAGGDNHSLALKVGGGVAAWGFNGYGQASPPLRLTNATAIAAGSNFSIAISLSPAIWNVQASVAMLGGTSSNLTPSVWSGSPFVCQWFFNNLLIDGATETNFALSSFDLSKAGAYSIMVSNQYGIAAATSVVRYASSPIVELDGADVGGGKADRIDSVMVGMTTAFAGSAHIHYTLDGGPPDFTDILYTAPFTLTNTATIRAIAYNSNYTDSAEAAAITVQIWPTYPLAATTLGGGSVGISPSPYSAGNRYVSNTVATLTATPASGWSFLNWTGDSTSTSNVTTVLMDRPRAAQAVFGTSLNLFTNGNGHVLLNPATGLYAFGSAVQLTALPAAGSYFFGWAGAASGFANPLFITTTNPAGITALFGTLNPNQVSLTVLANGDGSVSASPSKNVYTNGETVTLTALPGANRVFTGWSGGASGNLNPLGLTLTASTVITANFAPGSPTNPPVITQSPLSRTLGAGASTLLSFGLTGDGPFSYQWRFNGSPLTGATDPTLNLTSVSPSEAGRYDVVVIGASGSATSAPASVALFGLEMVLSSGPCLSLLTLDCAPGTGFQLEYSWDLSPTNWNLLAPVTLSGNRLYYVDSPDTNYFRRFYRAVPQ